MDSSDDDTFGEDSNINENSDNSDLGEIDEIFEEDDDDDQSSMICDQDNASGQDNLMPDESMDDAMGKLPTRQKLFCYSDLTGNQCC